MNARSAVRHVIGALILPISLVAQDATRLDALATVPRSVLEAETAAANFPTVQSRVALASLFLDRDLPGTSDRRCVETNREPAVRTGDFVVGSFVGGPASWGRGPRKLWWAPASSPDTLRLTAVRLDRLVEPRQSIHTVIAAPVGPDSAHTFHPTTVSLPPDGTWMMIATSGTSWGCLVLDFN